MMNENKRTIDQIINDYYPREKCESTWEVFRDLRRDELDLYLWIDEQKEGLNFINDEVDYKDKSRIIDHLLYNLHAATQYDLLDGVDIRLCAEIDVESYVKSIDKVLEHLSDKIARISYCAIANIDEDRKWHVTSSWEYEHSIFNLVHILKSIDWQEDTILFYGW